jgi:hypothetical protein
MPGGAGSVSGRSIWHIENGKPQQSMEVTMGRGILLFLLGVPIPIIILLALLWH